ncbi:MAG: heme exporter protein CcmD [Gammaproteobacteria bacterium]|jgi:heme exporter protein CcmD|nr:heme exporter protein CcmD [Chromatiales bacterium]MDP6674948.1 heme exporter protein CcmD [Gammaproteobacteria bacterium]
MAEFFAMGGYAQFVWGAFGIWFVCVIFNIVAARRKFRISVERATMAAARHHHRTTRKMKQQNDT